MCQVLSYQHALKFQIPNAQSQTLSPETNVAFDCHDAIYSPTRVTCLAPSNSSNNCGFPRTMYTGTDSLGVCFGHAYGLVASTPPANTQSGPVCGCVPTSMSSTWLPRVHSSPLVHGAGGRINQIIPQTEQQCICRWIRPRNATELYSIIAFCYR